MPSETAARQDAALAALRHLDAHVRSIMLPHDLSPGLQTCAPASALPACPAAARGMHHAPPHLTTMPLRLHIAYTFRISRAFLPCWVLGGAAHMGAAYHLLPLYSCGMPPRDLEISQTMPIMPCISLPCMHVQLAVSILQTGAGDQPCPPKPAGSTVEFNYWLRVPSAGQRPAGGWERLQVHAQDGRAGA